ncbi:cell division protein FtsZ [Shewanella sp.]|uniref:cell division protein FtsZ n=1 Tax=Shewanella sp. TaxID=50422 RepID=UPI00261D73BD|nr:cell division protein FtsZ [Shewanella sp.]
MFELITNESATTQPKLMVFGVGGCGCNTIHQLSQVNLPTSVELVSVNTDAQSMAATHSHFSIQIGPQTTKGLGAGAKPDVGCAAAIESAETLKQQMQNADIIFITAGLGGGTGTGALPQVAKFARELAKPVIAVVTLPFGFEGHHRAMNAKAGLNELLSCANAVIVLPNDKLAEVLGAKVTLLNAFNESNKILQDVLLGLANTISQAGLINIDLNDFISVISRQGRAAMGVSQLTQNEDLTTTVKRAMQNPLLDDVDLSQAQAAIVSVVAKDTIELSQYNQIGATVHQQLPSDALVIIGLTVDPNLTTELEVMVIATGITNQPLEDESIPQIDDKYINVHDFLGRPSPIQGLKPESNPELKPEPKLPPEPIQHHYDVNDLQIPTYWRQHRQASH